MRCGWVKLIPDEQLQFTRGFAPGFNNAPRQGEISNNVYYLQMKIMKSKISTLFFIALMMVTFANVDALAMPPLVENANLSGKWSSHPIGDVTITQTGNQIVGTYQYTNDDGITKDGKIEGILQGTTIRAKWWEHPSGGGRPQGRIGEESQGDLEWEILDNGKTLSGWYREEGEPEQGEEDRHEWNLVR
ncbi:hypothetical protein CCP3SC15_570012 [Gammaproteobacteria bacterium]